MIHTIIGQDKLKKYLSTEIQNDSLSYGYILEGDRFMGKEFIAQQIAEEITIPSYVTKLLPSGDRKLIAVDDIRAMRDSAYSNTFGNSKKVYIILNGDNLNAASQNAFLKVLEEPPQECIFIIIAEDRYNMLSTIRSRCTVLSLAPYTDADIKVYLESIDVPFDSETVRLCNGTLNKYLFLNSKEFGEISALADRILINIRKLHQSRVFAIFKHIGKKEMKPYVNDLLDLFILWYRDLYVYKITNDSNCIESTTKKEYILSASKEYETEEILNVIERIQFTKTKLKYNCNIEMSINSLLLCMSGVIK